MYFDIKASCDLTQGTTLGEPVLTSTYLLTYQPVTYLPPLGWKTWVDLVVGYIYPVADLGGTGDGAPPLLTRRIL